MVETIQEEINLEEFEMKEETVFREELLLSYTVEIVLNFTFRNQVK